MIIAFSGLPMVEYIGLERELYTSSLAVAFFPLGEGVANFCRCWYLMIDDWPACSTGLLIAS